MNATSTTTRLFTALFAAAFLGSTLMACDGGGEATHSTSTHALEARLDAASPAMSYDLTVRVFAPANEAAERMERVRNAADIKHVVEAGIDLSTSTSVGLSRVNLKETFAATVEAVANSEYIGEREVRDAVNQPFFTTFPIAACGGNFPCDLVVRIDVEAFDMDEAGSVDIDGSAWVASGYYDVEIVDVRTFATY